MIQRFNSSLWKFLLAVWLLVILSPLEFHALWLQNSLLALTFGSVSASCFLHFNGADWRSRLLRFLPGYFVVALFIGLATIPFLLPGLYNGLTGKWETVIITHRLKAHPQIIIAKQMIDTGAMGYGRRTVKILPLTPWFDWVLDAESQTFGPEWQPVNEEFNPFHQTYA